MAYAGFCQASGVSNNVEFGGKSCIHQVAWPPGEQGTSDPPPRVPAEKMAKEYPFSIDPFQQTAIDALENGDSVLVAAHTSAGKTVVAQYAMAMAIRDKSRVIYTSPLKALSNQKYREFYEEFSDVGLMTGDVTINPNATCLVMTTEILRSMLYHGSEIVREVQLLVYDEIHYIKDKERGVVWEESIILLPNQCQYAFLSATIPNAFEFAQWIANIHAKTCHVVYTDFRPVPLQHYIVATGDPKPHLVIDDKGRFREDNFQKALAAAGSTAVESGQQGKKQKKDTASGETSDMFKLIQLLAEMAYDPIIVFSFSKKDCEAHAMSLATMTLNEEAEQKLVEGIFWNAVDVLSEDDRQLPQITNALPMLKRGVAVHHSGLLPIVKEVIEILFQEGLIKVLFATETFSTGLNMPAKCVVFAGIRKFDGVAFRWLTGGEYIQMSGRAGRRGLDDKGVVVMMIDSKMEPAIAKQVIRGTPDVMASEFRLSYNMLLNVIRLDVAELRPEALITRSLRQWQMRTALPALEARAAALDAAADAVAIGENEDEEVAAEQLFVLLQELAALSGAARDVANLPQFALPFLQPGRLVRVLLPPRDLTAGPIVPAQAPHTPGIALIPEEPSADEVPGTDVPGVWAAVVNFERINANASASTSGPTLSGGAPSATPAAAALDAPDVLQSQYIVDVLVRAAPESRTARRTEPVRLLPCDSTEGLPVVAAVPLTQLDVMSSVRIILPKDLRPEEARYQGVTTLSESVRRLEAKFKSVPLLDREADMKVRASSFKKLRMKLERTHERLAANALYAGDPEERTERLRMLLHKRNIRAASAAVKRDIKDAKSMILKDELAQRLRVLRRLGYVSDVGVVTSKGQVAAVLQTGHELVLTELLFNGTLNALTEIQLAGLLSVFVWSEVSDRSSKVREDMEAPFAAVRDAARLCARVQSESGLTIDGEAFVALFRPDLIEVVTLWASGASFRQVAKVTTIFEGSLVRAIRRLEELLRQLVTACQLIGDLDFAERFEGAAKRIHRDVIFAASLYL